MRLIATTWYDDSFAPLGDLALSALARYCRRQGYELCLPAVARAERPAPWHKIEILRALLDRGADLLLWVDADAMVVQPERPIHQEIPADRDIAIVKHDIQGAVTPNTGVMLLRPGATAREFLDGIWRREEFLDHRWWENAAAMDLLGYHRALADGREDAPDPRWESRIHWLDPAWNAVPGLTSTEGANIRHYPGRSLPYRLANMRADNRWLGAREQAPSRMLSWIQGARRALNTP